MSRTSALARLQQGAVAAALGLTVAWCWCWWWRESPAMVALGVALLLGGHAVVLGLEFGLMAWVNRNDPAPRASLVQLIRAWWGEVRVAPWVFAYLQPFAWRRLPDTAVFEGPVVPRRGVVLVHGFVCNRGLWLPWMRELRARGVPYATVNLEPVFGSIDAYAPLIDEAVRRATAATGLAPLVVCHSMGGLAVRAWLAQGGARVADRVHHIVTIGTPHRGTWLGRLSRVKNGVQMNLHSPWQLRLASLESPPLYARFTCWYSNTDNIVFPASTATLPGADNRFIAGIAHVDLNYHPEVMRDTLAML